MTQIIAIEDNCIDKDDWLRVEWNIGKRCNYDCSYCAADIHDNTSDHMLLKVFTDTVDRLIVAGSVQSKRVKISLTGGEPFVNPNILQMLRIAKEMGVFKISATTNGSLPLKLYQQAMEFIEYIIVSYHFEFGNSKKILNTILGLDQLCKTYCDRKMHVHIMFLPGYLTECKNIVDVFNFHEITYAIRRIRPQIDAATGQYMLPHTSGMAGNSSLAALPSAVPYYSDEELKWLKSIL